VAIGDAVCYDDERFSRVESKDGITGVIGKGMPSIGALGMSCRMVPLSARVNATS